MGIFDALVGGTIGFAMGGPAGAVMGAKSGYERAKAGEQRARFERAENNMAFLGDPGLNPQDFTSTIPIRSTPTQASFLGGLGQTLGGFGRDVGGFFQDISPLTNLFGGGRSLPRTNSGTATTIINQRPDESASSGEILGANLGMGGLLLQAGRQLTRSPAGQTALGFGAGALGAAFSGGGNGAPRITRRMKSDVRRIYAMAGMDANLTAQILNNMGTYPRMDFDASLVFFILTKRFRNDGPVVTKAAVRKTKTTLRRMKGVVDMYNSVCKPTTRRAPARRMAPKAVQLIKN